VTPHHAGVGRRDALAGQVGDGGGDAGATGVPEAGGAEAEGADLGGRGPGVQQQVAAGDADVEGALADVDRDVARAEVEELDAVLGGDDGQVLAIRALAVAGLGEDVGRRQREGALVGEGDAQGAGFRGGVGHGCSLRVRDGWAAVPHRCR